MKFTVLICLAVVIFCGCSPFAENNKRVEQLNQQMTTPWLKEHIIVGKTTPEEVRAFFGNPLYQTASAGAGISSAFMPDEIWTYSVRFSEAQNSWSGGSVSRWTKSIAFSFKNGTVSDYQISSVAF